MTTRAIHEALRVMRIGLEPDGFRARLLAEAVTQLEALESEIRAAAETGAVSASAILKAIVLEPVEHYVVAVNSKNTPMACWPVASEAEAREVADTQSQCPGQRSWRLRVYRGDMLLASFSDGHERNNIYWNARARNSASARTPTAIKRERAA